MSESPLAAVSDHRLQLHLFAFSFTGADKRELFVVCVRFDAIRHFDDSSQSIGGLSPIVNFKRRRIPFFLAGREWISPF